MFIPYSIKYIRIRKMPNAKSQNKNASDEVVSQDEATSEEREVEISGNEIPEEVKEFIEAGTHFGHNKSKVHPGMFPYIFSVRNSVHIIDVFKTKEKLEEAISFLENVVKENKTILFVGTRFPHRKLVEDVANTLKMPYITNRWLGGTLTNWNTIYERIQSMKELRDTTKSEEWEKYPKHERMKMEEEVHKLEQVFGGIENMEKLPDALFITDISENSIAVREAQIKNIPIIAITDTDVNPEKVDYPIPANDDALASVQLILEKIKASLVETKKAKKQS